MRKGSLVTVLVLVVVLLLLVGCVQYRIEWKEPRFIAGTVTPAQKGIKVQLTQNYSLVAETFTDAEGNYKFENVSEGKYGLLFTKDELVYVYDDETNDQILNAEKNKVIVKEDITISSFSKYDINLDEQKADYEQSAIFLSFEYNVSKDKVNQLVSKYSLTILGEGSAATIIYYIVDIPVSDVVLKVLTNLNSQRDVYAAYYIPPSKKDSYLALLTVTRKEFVPYIDPEIIEVLKINNEVEARVTMAVDISWDRPQFGRGSTSEVFDEIAAYNYELKRPVIESLNETYFKIEGGLSLFPVFYGNMTKSGFEKLRKDSRILMITKRKMTSISS